MRTRVVVCLFVLLATALAQSPSASKPVVPDIQPIDPELKALADTERAFAKLGAEKGVRESFLAYFAPDGIWFTPHPRNTIEELRSRPAPSGPPPRKLEWAPMYGDVARSGELGYDTGPSKVTDLSGQNPPRYGYFFSVWKKQPNGDWRVALDLGTQNPADEWDPANPPVFTQAPASGYKASNKAAADPRRKVDLMRREIDGLLTAERAASTAAQGSGLATASAGFFDANARMHRNFMSPRIGAAAIRHYFTEYDSKAHWTPVESYVAKSGELGYTYGKYWAPGWGKDGAEETGYYVHVWRKDAQGKWKLVFHVDSPLPPQQN